MFIRSAILSLAALAAAKEMPKDEFRAAELFDSGIRHENNKALKLVNTALMFDMYCAKICHRKPGLRRKLLEFMLRLSTQNLRPSPTVPMVLQRQQRTHSSARTLISTISCPTPLWAVPTVLGLRRGAGPPALVASLLPSANLMVRLLLKSPKRVNCLTSDVCPSTLPAVSGERSVVRTTT